MEPMSKLAILKELKFNITHWPPKSNQNKACSLKKTHLWAKSSLQATVLLTVDQQIFGS